MRRAEHSGRTLLQVIVLLVLAALAYGIGTTLLLAPGSDSLRVHVASVRSSVSEALALVSDRDARKLTGPYFRTELELLTRDVEKAGASLRTARPDANLRPQYAEAAALASGAASRLRVLGAAGARPESVVAGQATLASIQLRVLSLEKELER